MATFVVDLVGCRLLLIGGTIGILCTLTGLGAFFATGTIYRAGILPIVTLMLYLVCLEFGLGPVCWLMSGEIFPNRLRAYGESIAVWANWVGNMIVTMTYMIVTMTYLTEIRLAGPAWTMWPFAFIAALGVVFIAFLVPETKGRSLEMIEDYWTMGRSWRNVEKKKRREERRKQRGASRRGRDCVGRQD